MIVENFQSWVVVLGAALVVSSVFRTLAAIRCKDELEDIASSLRSVVIYERERTRLLGGDP